MLPDSCAKSQTKQSHVHGSVPANPGVPFVDPDLEHLGSEGVGKITLSGEEAFVQWALGGGDEQNPKEALLCRVTLSLASLRKQLLGFSGFHRTRLRYPGWSAGDVRAGASMQAFLP